MAQSGLGQSHMQGQGEAPDPIAKFNMCIPILKESLINVMKIAAQIFSQNAQLDSCMKHGDQSLQSKLDKSLEEFYSICDKIELNLRLAVESYQQTLDSNKNTPHQVQGRSGKMEGPTPGAPEPQPYSQYLSTVKAQISCAKEIHDILVESAKKLGDKQFMQQPMPQQMQQQIQMQQMPQSMQQGPMQHAMQH